MFEIVETAEFARWLAGVSDAVSKARILLRIQRLAGGHFGDVKSVGGGVSELRIHTGPGYRIYFRRRGRTLVILLCAGDKDSQVRDIARATTLARETDQ